MGESLTAARTIYERLWRKTGPLLKSGRMQIDSHLRDKASDGRRGVTLVARPDATVRRRVGKFLHEAAAVCPRQHFYEPPELHVTVMAIIPGSEFWRDQMHQLPACQAVLDGVLKNRGGFRVNFHGVTVSPDAVMIQGFPANDDLSRLRDELRRAFGLAGLGGNLDRRYKTVTAHLTAMRFSEPEADWERLFDFLEARRETDFGQTHFQSLQLIWSNWYASADVVRVLQEYPLRKPV
ncbi:MAG TPA: 2'-5' RNA ligase family protein [Candidatus Sulfopaludibacter sp.]|nr:2'-5' RNA ligase family protein [Candidatus Sulfopaludibacter sp.]